MLKDVGFSDAEIDNFMGGAFVRVDTDRSGELDFDEFCAMYEVVKQKVIAHAMQMLLASTPATALCSLSMHDAPPFWREMIGLHTPSSSSFAL